MSKVKTFCVLWPSVPRNCQRPSENSAPWKGRLLLLLQLLHQRHTAHAAQEPAACYRPLLFQEYNKNWKWIQWRPWHQTFHGSLNCQLQAVSETLFPQKYCANVPNQLLSRARRWNGAGEVWVTGLQGARGQRQPLPHAAFCPVFSQLALALSVFHPDSIRWTRSVFSSRNSTALAGSKLFAR